jgi:hypothetical protein
VLQGVYITAVPLAVDSEGLGRSDTMCFGGVYVMAVPLAVGPVGLDCGNAFSY